MASGERQGGGEGPTSHIRGRGVGSTRRDEDYAMWAQGFSPLFHLHVGSVAASVMLTAELNGMALKG